MTAVAICAGLALLIATSVYFSVRRWAEAVAGRPEPLVDRVHRLRRKAGLLTFASLVVGGALGGVAVGSTRQDHSGTDRAIAVVAAVLCYLLPVLATVRAIRVPYARLRDVPVRIDGRLRRTAVSVGVLVVFAGTIAGGEALAPRGRAGHLAAVTGSYALILVLQSILSPLIIRATGLRPLPAELEARLRALAGDMGVRVRGFGVVPSRRQRIANALQAGCSPASSTCC